MALYAIGDVHGCNRTLQALIEKIGPSSSDELILLGDYVDRGPDSKGTIDFVRKLLAEDLQVTAIKGNHDEMFYDVMYSPAPHYYPVWMTNGGIETMKSFEAEVLSEMEPFQKDYAGFLHDLPLQHSVGSFHFVHAGFNLKTEDVFADKHAMLWIRDWYDEALLAEKLPGTKVIHGHTSSPKTLIESQLEKDSPFLNLDTGCVYKGRHEDYGYLAALNLDSMELTMQENVDF